MLHTPCTCRGTRWCKREGAGGPARGGIVWQEGANPSVCKPGAQKGGGDGTTLGVGVLLSSLHVAQKGWGVGEVGGTTRRARGWGWRSSGWGRSDRCPSAAGLARGWEGRQGTRAHVGVTPLAPPCLHMGQKGGAQGGDAARGPGDPCPGGGVKLLPILCKSSGARGKGRGGRTFRAPLWVPRLGAEAG